MPKMKEKYTAAELMKKVKELENRRRNILDKSERQVIFNCASTENEEDVRPEFDLDNTLEEIKEIDTKIVKYKHALNLFNAKTYVGDTGHTIDEVLVIMPQLTNMQCRLYPLCVRMRKERVNDSYSSPNYIDYTIANYDIDEANRKYKEINKLLSMYQLEMNKVNMTEIIEVEV